MKSGFSLLELIFAIVILGIVASFAIPKYIDTKDSALVSTLKRDVASITSSIQTYYLLNQKIDKIQDAIEVNETNWTVSDTKLTDKNECMTLEIKTSDSGTNELILSVDDTKDSDICKKIVSSGLENKTIALY